MTCVATRQQRLDNFCGGGEPPVGEPIELLCEDNSGTKGVGIFEVSALEADLEGVDRAMHILGVPMRHSDLFFSLKAHIDLVRARLGSRRDELHSKMIKAG
jgi:hypothetical protein